MARGGRCSVLAATFKLRRPVAVAHDPAVVRQVSWAQPVETTHWKLRTQELEDRRCP